MLSLSSPRVYPLSGIGAGVGEDPWALVTELITDVIDKRCHHGEYGAVQVGVLAGSASVFVAQGNLADVRRDAEENPFASRCQCCLTGVLCLRCYVHPVSERFPEGQQHFCRPRRTLACTRS